MFQIIKDLRKAKGPVSKGSPAEEDEEEEEESEEESGDGSQDSPSDFEPDAPAGPGASDGHGGDTEKPAQKLPSSGSGRSKERARMDLVTHEIKELEEQLKYHGVCLRPFSFHNPFHDLFSLAPEIEN